MRESMESLLTMVHELLGNDTLRRHVTADLLKRYCPDCLGELTLHGHALHIGVYSCPACKKPVLDMSGETTPRPLSKDLVDCLVKQKREQLEAGASAAADALPPTEPPPAVPTGHAAEPPPREKYEKKSASPSGRRR